MPFSLQCPGCGRRLKAPDALAGRRLPCPNCRTEVQVPERPVEDEAAALLMGDEPAAAPEPAPTPEPEPAAEPAPRRRGPVMPPTPVSALPPLKSNEPPVWLRHLHWLLVLALVPLAVSLLRKGDDRDILTRLDDTLESASPEARAKFEHTVERAGEDGVDLDDLIGALPRGRLAGAALSRDSHWHWAMALGAAVLFLGFFVFLSPAGQPTRSTCSPSACSPGPSALCSCC